MEYLEILNPLILNYINGFALDVFSGSFSVLGSIGVSGGGIGWVLVRHHCFPRDGLGNLVSVWLFDWSRWFVFGLNTPIAPVHTTTVSFWFR